MTVGLPVWTCKETKDHINIYLLLKRVDGREKRRAGDRAAGKDGWNGMEIVGNIIDIY